MSLEIRTSSTTNERSRGGEAIGPFRPTAERTNISSDEGEQADVAVNRGSACDCVAAALAHSIFGYSAFTRLRWIPVEAQ
jgi:hypothetical protein